MLVPLLRLYEDRPRPPPTRNNVPILFTTHCSEQIYAAMYEYCKAPVLYQQNESNTIVIRHSKLLSKSDRALRHIKIFIDWQHVTGFD
jgi:hypothetical protein